jgi:8-oxo-dGTP pyrophosphatase MutT (NUDIX family)
MMGIMKQRLKQALIQHRKQRVIDASRVPAAVLVPIYEHQGEHYIVFIKRTEKVKNHKGEITFPGGVFESDDKTLLNTALRESEEEIALAVDQVEVLGELDDAVTLTSLK